MPANTCDTDATTPFWATSTPLVCVSNFNRPDTKIEFHIFWSQNEETFSYPGQLLRYDAEAPNCHQIASKFVSSWDLRPSFSSCVQKLGVKLARFSPPSFTTYSSNLRKTPKTRTSVSKHRGTHLRPHVDQMSKVWRRLRGSSKAGNIDKMMDRLLEFKINV